MAKFSYRVVIVSRFAVAQHFLWRVIAATSLVAMPSARKNLAQKLLKHFMRRVTVAAKAVFRGALILYGESMNQDLFKLLFE